MITFNGMPSHPLLGSTELQTFYELSPLLPFSEWWHAILFALVVILCLAASVGLYFLDSRGLRPGVALALGILRIAAIILIVLFFLNPEKKSQKSITKNHRVSILVDTSSSMAGRDLDRDGATQNSSGLTTLENKRRIDAVVDTLIPKSSDSETRASLIESMRESHDVNVYRFDEEVKPEIVASLASTRPQASPEQLISENSESQKAAFTAARRWLIITSITLLIGLTFVLGYALRIQASRNPDRLSFLLTAGVLLAVIGLLGIAYAQLRATDATFAMLVGLEPFQAQVPSVLQEQPSDEEAENEEGNAGPMTQQDSQEIRQALNPSGSQTRLGDALTEVIQRERGNPLAGIIVFTDGQLTQGRELSVPEAAAIDAGIKIFPIGLGSPNRPKNVRIAELQAPQRVYPTDKFLVKGLIQSTGYEGQQMPVEVVAIDEADPNVEVFVTDGTLDLQADGVPVPFEFELEAEEIGKRTYRLRLKAPEEDFQPEDNVRDVAVEVVQRRNRVLIVAGGPTREYRFLRDQLHRDKDTRLHVYLQTAEAGIAQDAEAILFDFPSTDDEWNEYDCIISFDADWTQLSPEQARQFEDWIAKEAGGLILIAGPVFTPVWTRRARGDEVIDRIRQIYPVSFFNQGSATLRLGRFGGTEPFPLNFSREGRAASFLWLKDSAIDSQTAWDEFAGVYGYYAVNEPKPGALILAEFSDPDTEVDGKLPIYLASQFYGAGRVFFQASGEMWRLRTEDIDYFEQYYTKLIHWVSQGRLLRDSQRGFLIADKNQVLLGDSITFQAILRDEQNQPLKFPKVDLTIIQDNGESQPLTLEQAPGQQGSGIYTGRLTPVDVGNYEAKLPVPGLELNETLSVEFNVEIPQFEQQKPERNDEALTALAEETGGKYITDLGALRGSGVERSELEKLLQPNADQTHRVFLPPTVDNRFQRALAIWLLISITTVLCFEWVLRRTHRLA